MKRHSILRLIPVTLVCATVLSLSACSEKDVPKKSNEKKIISFSFPLTPKVDAAIDSVTGEITASLPAGTDITKLAPVIEVSPRATVSPKSGVAQDFSKTVSYTVGAENWTSRVYKVNVTGLKSSEKQLLSFKFAELTPEVSGIITEGSTTSVAVTVPKGTSLKTLKPTITVSQDAAISPASGIVQDFTQPVNYTITAQDGSTMKVVVKVREDNPTDDISKILVGKTWVYSEIVGTLVDYVGNPVPGKSNITVLKDGKSLYTFTPDVAKESFEFKADGTANVYDSFYEDFIPESWELSSDKKSLAFWIGSDKNGGVNWTFTTVSDTKMVVKEEYWLRVVDDKRLTNEDYISIELATITLVPKK